MSHRLVIYFLCPIEGGRHKFVLPDPTDEDAAHYLAIGQQIRAGTRYRAVGLWGFFEESADGTRRGPVTDIIIKTPAGIRTVRIEQDPADVQGELMEVSA